MMPLKPRPFPGRASAAVLAFAAFAEVTGAAPFAYVGNFKDNTVSVIDIARDEVVATIPVANGPHGMAQTTDGKTVFVSGDASSSISVIDTAAQRVRASIDVGASPHGLAMTPDGKWLLAGIYGEDRVAFIDPSTLAVTGAVPVAKPHTIAVRPDGKVAYAASQEPGKFALVVIDLAQRSVVKSIPLDKPPRDPEFSSDGRTLFVTLAGINAIQVVDTTNDSIAAQMPTGVSPHIAMVIRGPNLGAAVIQGPGELLLFDPATRATVRTIAVGKQPHWVAANADGSKIYVTNEGSNDVTAITVSSGQTQAIAVGGAPRKVLVQRVSAQGAQGTETDGSRVSIANFNFEPGSITVATGARVTWSNDDGAPHGLAYKDGARGAPVLLPGERFTRAFDAPGTYEYVCSVHPYMSGRVVVRTP